MLLGHGGRLHGIGQGVGQGGIHGWVTGELRNE